jgi:hypothetical protein
MYSQRGPLRSGFIVSITGYSRRSPKGLGEGFDVVHVLVGPVQLEPMRWGHEQAKDAR